ncbi:MAG: glycosyltransferase family 9 protein [Bacteroidales bacterium]|nr:glycosyltransferase family 9 protein [Bacteroidales bacterium]MCF8405307.1 glycosyltransferase family 9 protein [Bacteroidales bacterium]
MELNSILIIQTASIGDVILATPVIEKLHQHYPMAKIDFLLKKGNEELFAGHPFLHKVLVWDKRQKKYQNFRDLLHAVRDQKYDLVVNIQRFLSSGLLTILSGAKTTIGFNKNPVSLFFSHRIKHDIKSGEKHEVERNHELIRKLTDEYAAAVKLYPSQQNYAKMSQYKTKRYITISPASLWFTKQFPKKKWIELLHAIDRELQVYCLGSASDQDLCKQIIDMSGHKLSLNLCGKLSFLESVALMKDAVMNYTNDSAPMHLASAANAKTTAIFCSTIPGFGFGPLSDNAKIAEIDYALACRPCGLHGLKKCPKGHFKCAYDINIKELINNIRA